VKTKSHVYVDHNLAKDCYKMIYNRPHQLARRRELRKNSSAPEERLWSKLRRQQLGVRFRRQHGVGRYITDFYCAEWALVIELDGDSHFTPETQVYDAERDRFMYSLGLRVLRFLNRDVMENMEGVVEQIVAVGNERFTPSLTLPLSVEGTVCCHLPVPPP
jgi:very-short-patch-repair endonuclease